MRQGCPIYSFTSNVAGIFFGKSRVCRALTLWPLCSPLSFDPGSELELVLVGHLSQARLRAQQALMVARPYPYPGHDVERRVAATKMIWSCKPGTLR